MLKFRKYICLLAVFLLCCNFIPVKNEAVAEEMSVVYTEFFASVDGSGESLPDLNGAEAVSVKVGLSNGGAALKKAGIYLAYYDENNTLLNIAYDVFDAEAGKETAASIGMDIAGAKKGRYVKAFVWDEAENAHKPIIEGKRLDATEDIYVSPSGNDDSLGTFSEPLKTIEAAKNLVRARNQNMEEDICVYMREGTYYQDNTLSFETADSGTNGKSVIYSSYNDENAVISGGKPVENWEIYDEEKNIWKAEFAGVENIRELYVNGKRARRAMSEKRVYPKGFYKKTQADSSEETLGYIVSADDAESFENAEDVQLHFTQIWKNTLLNVDEIIEGEEEGTYAFILNPDAFSKTISSLRHVPLRHDTSFYIENALELLDTEGEFYHDGNYLYYMPEKTEDMEASCVIAPTLEKLVEVRGDSLNEKVKNISFDGITFAHASRSDMDSGYLGDQAQEKTPIYEISSSYPLDNTFAGANIRVSKALNISFTNNVFMGLSAVGVGLYDGANNVKIEGNCFYDLGDSAISAGLPSDAFMEDVYESGVNVALYKPVTSNGVISTSATYANDGDRTTIWSNPTSSKSDYLQIDLGKEYKISEVRLKARLGTTESATNTYKTQAVHRRGFTIYASNDADFSDGGVSLATVSNTAGQEFDYDAGFTGVVTSSEKYRYIRFSTTVNKHFPLAEIEVISPDETDMNKEVCKNALILNNYITRVGEQNFGAPAIQLYHVEGFNVLHNTLKDLPYSGICLGWGWLNKSGSETTKNNTINYNLIDGVALKMYDAGAIYLNGPQINTQIKYNYIKNQKNIYYALYPDSGADNFTATDNVIEDVNIVFALGREGNLSAKAGIKMEDNYSTCVKYSYAFTEGNDSVVEAPIFYLRTNPPEEVSAIKQNAGLEPQFKGLISKVPSSRFELSDDDIYGDVIDRHVGSYKDTITSLTDYNLVLYYLSYKIDEAKAILEAGKEYADEDAYNELNGIITQVAKIRTNYYTQTQPTEEEKEAGGTVHTTENLDRRAVIETRITLENAIEEYLNSFA